MYQIRANQLESDLINQGFADSYGDVYAAIDAFRFDDRRQGGSFGIGGLIGKGSVLVDRFTSTKLMLQLEPAGFIEQVKPLSGVLTVRAREEELVSNSSTALVSVISGFRMFFNPEGRDMDGLHICLRQDALDSYLEQSGEICDGPMTGVEIGDSGQGGADAALLSFVGHVTANIGRYATGSAGKSGQLAEALFTDIFVDFLQASGVLQLKRQAIGARSMEVARAEDFMREKLTEPITIADVASATEISLRCLQYGFRALRGTTPRKYLMAIRLERARELLQSHAVPSVTGAALESGIFHLGRFSQAYKAKYGELPSDTLQRQRR